MDFFHFSARLLSCHLLYFYFAINTWILVPKSIGLLSFVPSESTTTAQCFEVTPVSIPTTLMLSPSISYCAVKVLSIFNMGFRVCSSPALRLISARFFDGHNFFNRDFPMQMELRMLCKRHSLRVRHVCVVLSLPSAWYFLGIRGFFPSHRLVCA